ncbi:MAG: hypothetical protein NTY35_00615 [Planctomycetota bacterium]|nr:hypothetical protein [Planctomycetota bacterium]
MLAGALALAAACALLLPRARAQAPEGTAVVEGPFDADVLLDGVERALDLLVAGDKAWKEGRSDAAFDAWRSALSASAGPDATFGGGTVVGSPPGPGTDADGTLARRAEDCAWSVRRRIALLAESDCAAWSARFEALADLERLAAGPVPELLARVQREFPFTRAAARAALALGDQASERGDASAARAWLQRAESDAGEDLRDALASRARQFVELDWPRADGEFALRLERVVELGPADDDPFAAIPGIALERSESLSMEGHRLSAEPARPPEQSEGTTWFHGGGRLLRFDPQGEATAALDVRAALRAQGLDASPAFSEPGAPWDEAFALGPGVLALVEGRAREDRGNALVGIDARSSLRVAWAWDSTGLAREGARIEGPEIAGVRALLEFQPGPLLVGDTLVAHVRAWPRAAEGSTEVDEARAESWCAGLDPRDGTVRWSRRLATGSTLRGMDRGRRTPPEPTTLPALQPLDLGGSVALDTGLGAVALLDAVDGRVAWIVRTARRGARPVPAGGIAGARGGGSVWFAPATAEGALLRLRSGPDADGKGLFAAVPLVLNAPRIPGSAGETEWVALAPAARGIGLVRKDLATGNEVRSAAIPFSALERGAVAAVAAGPDWIVAAGGRAYGLDPALRLLADLDLGPRSAYARVAAASGRAGGPARGSGRPIRIAGPQRIAFLVSN